jgi:hypothetical protein
MRTVFMMGWVIASLVTSVAMGQAKHAKVEATAKTAANGIEITLNVVPQNGNVINHEAPWKAELKAFDGLKVAAPAIKGEEAMKLAPTFVFKAEPQKASGKAEYSVTAFVCSKDKTNCYRDVVTGAVEWKK